VRYARTFRGPRTFGAAGGRAKDGAHGRELAGMITRVAVYRNRVGEVFFRLSATAGRTRGCEVRAERGEDLDRAWTRTGFDSWRSATMPPARPPREPPRAAVA